MVNPRLFVVRVWYRPARFRVAVRDVAQERVHLFDSAETVVDFLTEAAANAADDDDPAASPPSSIR